MHVVVVATVPGEPEVDEQMAAPRVKAGVRDWCGDDVERSQRAVDVGRAAQRRCSVSGQEHGRAVEELSREALATAQMQTDYARSLFTASADRMLEG